MILIEVLRKICCYFLVTRLLQNKINSHTNGCYSKDKARLLSFVFRHALGHGHVSR